VIKGVVSENMIAIRDQMQKEDEQREERTKTAASTYFNLLFVWFLFFAMSSPYSFLMSKESIVLRRSASR